MAVVVDALVGGALSKLSALIEEKGSMMLGVKDDLKKLQRTLERLKKFLQDAENKSIQDASIKSWLGELKDFVYDADDLIDHCRIEGTKLLEGHQPTTSSSPSSSVSGCFSIKSCFSATKFRYWIAEEIKSLNLKLKEIVDNKPMELVDTGVRIRAPNRPESSPHDESEYVGQDIEEATQSLVKSLTEESDKRKKCDVLGIVGMGGIGKTTLASKVYNHPSIVDHFKVRIWVCVSQTYSGTDILKQIIRGAGGVCGEASSKAELHSLLISSLLNKFFLIVLDDVWSRDVWEDWLSSPLKKCGPSGKVLVTTRDQAITLSMHATSIHNVEKMNNLDGWALLCKKVFEDTREETEILMFKEVGIKIVDKCDGLPLAIKAIAGVLSYCDPQSINEWEKHLQSHAWTMSQLPEDLRGPLYLSYEDLPSHLRQCFLYLSLYPEDSYIYKENVINYWVSEGFIKEEQDTIMEETANDYFKELVRRSLLQQHMVTSYIMHDLFRTLAQYLVGEENVCVDKTLMNRSNLQKIRRLSFFKSSETESNSIRDIPPGLRTIISFGPLPPDMQEMLESDDLGTAFSHLRVLHLGMSTIKKLPDSLGKLIHLRHLYVDEFLESGGITQLPKSIGNLVNLQVLCLSYCKNLVSIPSEITQLVNLRCMSFTETPSYFPKRIGRLKQLNRLEGFCVADVGNLSESSCNIEDLQPLSQLRVLSIEKLERVISATSVLRDKIHMRELSLIYTTDLQYSETEIKRAEKVMEELFPPPNLQRLNISRYPGCRYPSWMSLHSCFSRL